jgi:hypothetical protein
VALHIHYQPLTGPVWTEPVASRLQWLPRGEPARRLEVRSLGDSVEPPFYALFNPNGLQWLPSGRWPIIPEVRKLGDFQQPPFDALYKPQGLQWLPSAAYQIRALTGSPNDWTVELQLVTATVYDPSTLGWTPSAAGPRTISELRKSAEFAQPAFDALYKPEQLGWQPSAAYLPRALATGFLDLTVFPIQFTAQPFDPKNLEWIPKGNPPSTLLETRKLGDFVQPGFDALYKPELLQWIPSERLLAKGIQFSLQAQFTLSPFPISTPYDPALMMWVPMGAAWPQATLERRILGDFQQPPFDTSSPPPVVVVPPVATGSVPGFVPGGKKKRKKSGPYMRENQVFGEEYPVSPTLNPVGDEAQTRKVKAYRAAIELLLKELL